MTPAIILIEPQMGENIGAAARAMENFGLNDLRIVNPRDGWPNEKAYAVAASATRILDNVTLFSNTNDAVADLHTLIATTGYTRKMIKPVITPKEAAQKTMQAGAQGNRVGLLFGAERTGLANDDIVRCDSILVIPTSPDYTSLNLAQAIVVVAYEWFCASTSLAQTHGTTGPNATPVNPDLKLATAADVQGMLDHLESELDKADFWKEWKKKPLMWQNLRNIFTRNPLAIQEVRTLRGVIRCLVEGR
jgi:tRNA/rRNA methyltransferase